PGRPDLDRQARERAVLPLDGPRLVVVLGCTVGAGQTMTTFILAELLAELRGEPVAALDLNPGPASLATLATQPATTVSALLANRNPAGRPAHAAAPAPRSTAHRGSAWRGSPRVKSQLDVISEDPTAPGLAAPGRAVTGGAIGPEPASANLRYDRLFSVLASRYTVSVADPGASAVSRVLPAADQLVLVVPASPDAAQAVGMTCEWLEAHGHGALSASSIAVVNGVSQRSMPHAEQAELAVRGRCRAIVRVPWDDHLAQPQAERGIRASREASVSPERFAQLRPAVLQAHTALAGVLVATMSMSRPRTRSAQ
ncbi:MAG TPA: hypothetical protein VGS19_26360, partial [Streptosporangiaceae bacterium]|nr:hypothetical protein [Streptosporangiaceae bacterium]